MAKFCNTNALDAETVGLVTSILAKSKRIMPKLDYQDKWPNIDGYLYFLEKEIKKAKECSEVLGTFEVQIKKLPKNHKLRFSLETDFLKYCQKCTINPIILLGVDLENEELYWLQIDKSFINCYKDQLNKKYVRIEFIQTQKITKTNNDFVPLWEHIIIQHKNKLGDYDRIKETLDSYQIISENSKFIPIKRSNEYIQIHKFLDYLNNYLDNDFNIIKQIFFPNTWKLGFAFKNYEPNNLSYSLFDISYDVNDVQIKKIITGNINTLMRQQNISSFNWSRNNDIEFNPKKVAVKWVENKIKDLIKHKLLRMTSHEVINDFLYEFITHFNKEFGLDIKDNYSLSEITKAYNEHLLLWIEELYKLKQIPLERLVPVELGSSFIFAQGEEFDVIESNVQKRINNGDFSKNQFIFTSRYYDFSKFLRFLEEGNIQKINSITKKYESGKKDLAHRTSSWMWEKWSKEEAFNNTKYLYTILPKIYDETIKENFPLLFDDLKFFNGFNKLIVVVCRLKNEYSKDYRQSPGIKIYRVQDDSVAGTAIEVIDEANFECVEEHSAAGWYLIKNKEKLTLKRSSSGMHTDIFHRFPTLAYLYKLIEERLKEYFSALKERA